MKKWVHHMYKKSEDDKTLDGHSKGEWSDSSESVDLSDDGVVRISRNKLCTKENSNNKFKENFRWRKREPPDADSTFYGKEFPDPLYTEISPCMYFKQFFDDDLIKHIADQTNLYSVQCTGKSINVDENEIQQYSSFTTRFCHQVGTRKAHVLKK